MGQDKDAAEARKNHEPELDTEGHLQARFRNSRPQAVPPIGPGEHGVARKSDSDFLDDRDTEGHLDFRRLPGTGGE